MASKTKDWNYCARCGSRLIRITGQKAFDRATGKSIDRWESWTCSRYPLEDTHDTTDRVMVE